MILAVKIKLKPWPEQAAHLHATLKRGNEACNAISKIAFDKRLFGQVNLHKAVYYNTRAQFQLPSQLTIRCIGKVSNSYKTKPNILRQYRPLGAIPFDDRNLKFNKEQDIIRIRALDHQEKIPYVVSDRDRALLEHQKGECDLFTQNDNWYLSCPCEIQEEELQNSTVMIGVDLGIAQIATTSDGEQFSGEEIEVVRIKRQKRRTGLQSKGSKSAKRRLKKNSKKEKNFRKDVNHCISKRIVAEAKRTGRGIVLENLKGIRDRQRVRKAQRSKFSGWSFAQLRQFICYKARRAGVPVYFVNPKYTSQRCHKCAHIEKANRKSQSEFRCHRCGHEDNADVNAAKNIKSLGEINTPHGRVAEFSRL